MSIIRFNSINIFFILMSLDSIAFNTSFGKLPISLIGSFLFLLKIINTTPKISKNISLCNLSLLSIGFYFSITSLFIGDSIIGNLSRIWVTVLIAYFLQGLEINIETLVRSIKNLINFHFYFLIFDFFFETPWGWNDNIGGFFIGFNTPDLWRASGLFSEPSFYCLLSNCLLFILMILKNCSINNCLIVLGSNLLTTSISGTICSVIIILNNYSYEINSFLKRIFSNGIINKNSLKTILFSLFLLLPVLIFIFNHHFLTRVLDPINDNSIIGRTLGTIPIVYYVFKNSPLFGLGLGDEGLDDILVDLQFLFANKIVYITTVNSLVGMFTMGGIIGLVLYLIYITKGLQKKYLFSYFVLLCSSGKVFFIFLFLIPAFNKFFINKQIINFDKEKIFK